MAVSDNQTLDEDPRPSDQAASQSQQQWDTMARAWLTAFPEPKAVTIPQVEAWIDTNRASLPPDLQSMPRPDLIDRLLAIQNIMRLPTQEQTDKPTSPKGPQTVETSATTSLPSNNIPRDSAKRNEALRKYEMLVQLEKMLAPHFSKGQGHRNGRN